MKADSVSYAEQLKVGSEIERILRKYPDIYEEALDSYDRKCLELYQSSCQEYIDMQDVKLKPWQKKVIQMIDSPTERTICWIVGKMGNEGKTFIQKYILQLFGMRRVLKTEINAKKADIAYMLSKDSLTCKDIFLLNLLRSDNELAYGLLENIKDGYLISSKYSSKHLKIKTPNTVLVFSNSYPTTENLSADRWKIYYIHGDDLFESNLSSKNHTSVRSESNSEDERDYC